MVRPSSRPKNTGASKSEAKPYKHTEAESLLRPDVGTQAQFRKRKPPARYRYDSSLAPELAWDGQNGARELGEWLIAAIEDASKLAPPHRFESPREFKRQDGTVVETISGLQDALARLKSLSRPFLNWASKVERLSFDVPTLPLFVHERLSTEAILTTLKGHKRDKQQTMDELFGDPALPIHSQVLRAYEHKGGWVNRMVLGDSLVVMNSLLRYEGLGGQVQMIYMDPPYGVKFGSNFQPFVRKRDVKHGDDDDMTREPEMVKAYRDTWELGLHSYLTYMRDRLLLSRELLTNSGSIFVQISDENLHHLSELLDETFGRENYVGTVKFVKTSGSTADFLPSTVDYLLWYARDIERLHYQQLFMPKEAGARGGSGYNRLRLADGSRRPMTARERLGIDAVPGGARIYCLDNLTSQSLGREKGEGAACWFPIQIEGREFLPNMRSRWKTNESGMAELLRQERVEASGSRVGYVRFLDDFPFFPLSDSWDDVMPSFMADKAYVVQTSPTVIERCLLMTTRPGDLVLDPTCGSGTTAYVAEQWGRRWITIDASRVPLALARQRILTATFQFHVLKEDSRGPAGGFVYKRKTSQKGEEVGGIVPHITLKSIATRERPEEEVLVDRPEQDKSITRVSGPFCVEATIPTPMDWDEARPSVPDRGDDSSFTERLIEIVRRSPNLHLPGGKTVTLRNIRVPAKTLGLSAEALVSNGEDKPVALVFGPENGAVSERLVAEAAKEAAGKRFTHLYVIGFAIQPNARELVEHCEEIYNIPATYAQATPDLMMSDLLKNMRSSQIFSVCGLPDVKLSRLAPEKGAVRDAPRRFQVELRGLDVFDPVTMQTESRKGDDVPVWFLDTDYNGLSFHVSQAFFPRTAAWDDLKRSLRGQYEDSVWDHLAGAKSAPFDAGDQGQIAVKVIDDRGNELMVVKKLDEAVN